MIPSGYTFRHVYRPEKRGGGVAITHNSTYRASIVKTADYSGFESIYYDFKLSNTASHLSCIYTPPGQASVTFFDHFASFLEDTTLGSETIIIAADFNIHVDNPHCASTKKLIDVLDRFFLSQKASFPTHISGHCLDLMITRSEKQFNYNLSPGIILSDYYTIVCDLTTQASEFERRQVSYRKIKDIDLSAFKEDILTVCPKYRIVYPWYKTLMPL